jgi:hypothetical protein
VAASTEAARVLELFQLQNDQGPCLDCFRAGQPVAAPDLTATGQIWPQFAAAARRAGFAAVQGNLRLSDLAQAVIDGTTADFPGLTAPVGPRPG